MDSGTVRIAEEFLDMVRERYKNLGQWESGQRIEEQAEDNEDERKEEEDVDEGEEHAPSPMKVKRNGHGGG